MIFELNWSAIKQNPPYDLMVDLAKVSTGRAEETLSEPNLSILHQLASEYHQYKDLLSLIITSTELINRSDAYKKMKFLL